MTLTRVQHNDTSEAILSVQQQAAQVTPHHKDFSGTRHAGKKEKQRKSRRPTPPTWPPLIAPIGAPKDHFDPSFV